MTRFRNIAGGGCRYRQQMMARIHRADPPARSWPGSAPADPTGKVECCCSGLEPSPPAGGVSGSTAGVQRRCRGARRTSGEQSQSLGLGAKRRGRATAAVLSSRAPGEREKDRWTVGVRLARPTVRGLLLERVDHVRRSCGGRVERLGRAACGRPPGPSAGERDWQQPAWLPRAADSSSSMIFLLCLTAGLPAELDPLWPTLLATGRLNKGQPQAHQGSASSSLRRPATRAKSACRGSPGAGS